MTTDTPWRRAVLYPILGAVLAAGAPLGLLVLRRVVGESTAVVYAYVCVSTAIAFVVLGWYLGRSMDALRKGSLTDGLTGLANRRHFDLRLRDETARARRHGTPLAMLLVDVDRLKDINDRGGHEAGDVALAGVAAAIAHTCRTTDLAARFGGDEFAVLLPLTGAKAALELAERVRAMLHAARPDGPTVSIGVADLADATTPRPEGLCQAADHALYAAKASGRDRAMWLSPPARKRGVALR